MKNKKALLLIILFALALVIIGIIFYTEEKKLRKVTKEVGESTQVPAEAVSLSDKMLEKKCIENEDICTQIIYFTNIDGLTGGVISISNNTPENIGRASIIIKYKKDNKKLLEDSIEVDLKRRTQYNMEYNFIDKRILEADDYEIAFKKD